MQNSTPRKRRKLPMIAAFGTGTLALATVGAMLAGVTPATAASLAAQPDIQVAVFMVPLILLVLVLLFEVGRFARRGALPAHAPTPRPKRTHWNRPPGRP